MKEIEECIKEAKDIFSDFDKPKNSIDFENDPEYTEYNDVLRNITKEELTIEHLGDVAFGVFGALSSQALGYYLPRIIEFTLYRLNDISGEPFMSLFINIIGNDPNSEKFCLFKRKHKKAIYKTFSLIKKYYNNLIKENCWNEELDIAIEKWDLL